MLKKILSTLTAVAVTIFVSSGSLQTLANEFRANAAETEIIYGDVNDDKKVDIFDVTLIKKEIIDPGSTNINLTAADVNIDGIVDIKDANEIQDYLLGITKGFTGSVKKAFSNINRTFITENINGEAVFGDETQITKDMANLAEILNSPAAVFLYVLNNIKTEFYYGSRKGAVGTFEEGGGNDYDQASLLIAMLRYLGYNAYYAVGDVVFSDDELINMTAASNIESAKKIFTSCGKILTPYETGGYLTEQVMVYLIVDEENDTVIDPSFKYYSKKINSIDFSDIMTKLDTQYSLSDSTLEMYDVSNKLESQYNSTDWLTTFQQYEIIQQNIDNYMIHYIPSNQFEIETSLLNSQSDMITFSLGNMKIYQKKTCCLYGKDITLEYEFTEDASLAMDVYFNFDSIDDLTQNLGTYTQQAQIHGVLKVDGETKAYNTDSYLLGEKEMLQIDITSSGKTRTITKELTVGALYSITLDYQIISPYEIADGYAKLPQTSIEQKNLNESNIYGSRDMMNTLSLLGKSYFSQLDTNNAILASFADMRYERELSVAIVDFTPHIYNQVGSSPRLYKEGTINIDVLDNKTIFVSLKNDTEEEEKIKHSTGYISSFCESEVIKQFTGMQTVSTAEVLKQATEHDIDILYLSKANINQLELSKLSDQNKADITKYINEGKYITVPNEEITIGAWSGTGYIVYDPSTGTNAYIINNNLGNNINGGGLCSWVGLSFLCNIIATVIECTWAFHLIMLGATIFGTGLILLTGGLALIPLLISAAGLGVLIAGGFYLRNIEERLYETRILMDLYMDGNEEAGKSITKNGYKHLEWTAAIEIASPAIGFLFKSVSSAFAKTNIGKKALGASGKYLMDGFANSKFGIVGALDLLNSISSKYAGMLCDFLVEYGNPIAKNAIETYYGGGKIAVEERLDDLKGSDAKHITKYDNIDINNLAANNPTKLKSIISDIRQTGGSPVEIPAEADANAIAKTMNKGYQQIKYRWSEGIYNFEARWHTETPGAMKYERGTTWVVTRTIPGTPKGQERVTEYLVGDTWIHEDIWTAAEKANIAGTATQEQMDMLEAGHWLAK
ncbi:Transglutaminase-like superfamily protein [Ruminococcus flavefaciens]|uniref:Transglutaminase-like superfamily protein n=2 Tax=Ruminococcus flavefaciens TaxID=1265 RepID=A0A1H6LU29_RUMFL|nr:Transglutaminase-like superfamily protein [Ruminococcus flavefaciens]